MVSELLTLTQAASLTGTSTRQLRYAVTRGTLPAKVIGRAYVVARADLDAWHPPAPGANLDAYWRDRGKRGLVHKDASAGAQCAETPTIAGNSATCTSPERGRNDPTYAPALVRMRDGSTTPAEVILDDSGAPDAVVSFGLFTATRRDVAGFPSKAGGTFLYDEVD